MFYKKEKTFLLVKHSHPLITENTHKLEEEEKVRMVALLKTGNPEEVIWAKNQLTEGHMKLIFAIAYRYSGHLPMSWIDDMIGQGCLALSKALEEARTKLIDDNITGYIISKVTSYLSHYLTKERRQSRHVKYVLPKTLYEVVDSRYGDLDELLDILKQVVKDPREKEIISLRRQGHTDAEIGMMLGLSEDRIRQIRHTISRRFLRKLEGR